MRVVCTNSGTQQLKLPWMDEPVEFASTGTSGPIPAAVGERLVDEVAAIEPYDSHGDDSSDSNG